VYGFCTGGVLAAVRGGVLDTPGLRAGRAWKGVVSRGYFILNGIVTFLFVLRIIQAIFRIIRIIQTPLSSQEGGKGV